MSTQQSDEPTATRESATVYTAQRVTLDSRYDFEKTRSRFEQQVRVFSGDISLELVLAGATWSDVRDAVDTRMGPTGLVALARLDQGALLSLSGEQPDATLYLVGNPVVAREVTRHDPARLCTRSSALRSTATPPGCTSSTTSRPAASRRSTPRPSTSSRRNSTARSTPWSRAHAGDGTQPTSPRSRERLQYESSPLTAPRTSDPKE